MDNRGNLNFFKLIKQIIMYLPGSIFPAFFVLLSTVIFTRIFGPAEFGRYSLVQSIILLIVAVSSQWLQQAVNRFIPAQQDKDNAERYKLYIIGSLILILFLQLMTAIIAVPILLHFASIKWHPYIIPAVLLIMVTALFNSLGTILQSEMKVKIYCTFYLINAILNLLLSIGLILTIYKHITFLLWASILTQVILLPCLWRVTRLKFPLAVFKQISFKGLWSGIKKFAGYGLPMTLWFLAANFLNVGDRYVIGGFRGTLEVGIYAANYSLIVGAVNLLSTPVSLAAHPFFIKAWETGDKHQTADWLGIIVQWFIISGSLLVGFVWLFSMDFALWFLGPQFRQGHLIMPFVTAGLVIWQMGMYTHKPLEFAFKTKQMMFIGILAAVVNLGLNLIFIPKYGYYFAAYSTVTSYLLYNITVTIAGKRIISWSINQGRTLAGCFSIVIGCILIKILRVEVESSLGYIAGVLLTTSVYMLFSGFIFYFNGFIKLLKRS